MGLARAAPANQWRLPAHLSKQLKSDEDDGLRHADIATGGRCYASQQLCMLKVGTC